MGNGTAAVHYVSMQWQQAKQASSSKPETMAAASQPE